jgi:hypothetical protein
VPKITFYLLLQLTEKPPQVLERQFFSEKAESKTLLLSSNTFLGCLIYYFYIGTLFSLFSEEIGVTLKHMLFGVSI